MDFARKQLEKYGWKDGKGLGKNENGIAEALKPKVKRSVAGVGHDPAAEFNEHWWTALYDKAAGNVEVQEKNGKTKKIQTNEDDFAITNNIWKMNKKKKENDNEDRYSGHFIRTAVMTDGPNKIERVKESDSEEEVDKKDVCKMTDEELFAFCEGRTAHKGARHGLKATGKLARIAQQEALLLKETKYSGYSHAKKIQDKVVEEISLQSDSEATEPKKKKKKRKRCNSNESIEYRNKMAESCVPLPNINETTNDDVSIDSVTIENNEENISKKSKKKKKKVTCDREDNEEHIPKTKKKKHKDVSAESIENVDEEENLFGASNDNIKKNKKKKSL